MVADASQSVFLEPAFWAIVALCAGAVLALRGLSAYRRSLQVQTIGTSRIATAAAGEVRLSGNVVQFGPLLNAPATGSPCVYYRATARRPSESGRGSSVSHVTASTAFALDDGSGRVTVFSRGASWDVPDDFEHTPPSMPASMTPDERAAAAAQLLTVQLPPPRPELLDDLADATYADETRIDVGDRVTVVGSLLPFGQLADIFEEEEAVDDPVIALELQEARAAGELAASPEEAWGNAAIPGFGIGRPVRPPVLDPEARPLVVTAVASTRTGGGSVGAVDGIDLGQETLVVAAGRGHPLAIFAGTPGQAVVRADVDILLGAVGACVAILAILALAALVSDGSLRLPGFFVPNLAP